MSVYTSTATVIGVSYLTLVEEGEDEKIQEAATEVGLEVWDEMPKLDCLTDMYVGVVFYDRPTDAEVEEAKKKVEAALPKLRELLGEPDSEIDTWNGVCVS